MAIDAARRESGVVHRRYGIGDHKGREVGGGMTVDAGRGANRNVVSGHDLGGGGAGPGLAQRVTGLAAAAGDYCVIHRRALVGDHEGREHRGTVAALAGRGAERNVIGRWEHECRWRYICKTLARRVALHAVARDVQVVHDRQAVVARGRVAQRAVVVVRHRQRDVVARQIGGALEARGVEVTGRAFARDHVRSAIGLERRAHQGGWRSDPAHALLVAG